MQNNILVTGAAGFLGFHLCKKLLLDGYYVIGIDNINSYYDINLKKSRLKNIERNLNKNSDSWNFYKTDLTNKENLFSLFNKYSPKVVINLSAQSGVSYSI